ncbi:MAG: fumarylacetoacetate hydrolase family protein [Bacteroidales bacterium]|nr:fumarylacetoacetate hydrolase family protein [Bacteroidales bacterium]MDD6781823.1 fumarylacetoacetate hydrolase family protein [Bacteroidales bacterium]
MKIFCIGWNYATHNAEMQCITPGEPTVFMKPDTALLRENRPFYIPHFSNEIEYEAEIVVRINRLGKNIDEKFAARYYDEIAFGIDFTARDLQRRLRAQGEPWEISKAFDGSAAISSFVPLSQLDNPTAIDFSLTKNGQIVQHGNTQNLIFGINKIIAHISRFFFLKMGDLIYTGTPAGVGRVEIGDHLEGFVEGTKLLDCQIK